MKIHTHPNFKTFLFFIIMLICGCLSVALAFYLEKYFPHAFLKNDQKSQYEIKKASFVYNEENGTITKTENFESGDLTGMIYPVEEAKIFLISPSNTYQTSSMERGRFYFSQVKTGNYEMVIQPNPASGIATKIIDQISVVPEDLKDLGVLELEDQ